MICPNDGCSRIIHTCESLAEMKPFYLKYEVCESLKKVCVFAGCTLEKVEFYRYAGNREALKPAEPKLEDYLPEFIEAFKAQLESDRIRWGHTWMNRPKVGQEARTRSGLQIILICLNRQEFQCPG